MKRRACGHSPVGGIIATVAATAAMALVCVSPRSQGAPAPAAPPALPAFPGAEGFGSHTPGGRGGRVIEVTTLESEGPGSLRAAVEATGPRIIVFRVGGTIDLQGGISVRSPFVTIAGQTAPGDGICLKNGTLSISTHDVVVRYLRVRVGDGATGGNPENRDCLSIAGPKEEVYNVVVDHCSFSWGLDENIQTWYSPRDITVQWCITSESLYDSLHPKGPHGMGMLLGSQGNTVTVHHCLLAHNNDRNPLINSGSNDRGEPAIIDFRNNTIYNHGPWSCASVAGSKWMNYVGNTIKMGPNGLPDSPRSVRVDANPNQRFFVKDNDWPGRPQTPAEEWKVLQGLGATPRAGILSDVPLSTPPVTTQPAADASAAVLRLAGAILPVRDVVDARVVEEVRTGTGKIINTQADVSGWPEYRSAPPPADADHDGMPDAWEARHGLDPKDAADGPKDRDGDGYTNVEGYLNATDPAAKTATGPLAQADPAIQQGNDALRFGAARVPAKRETYDPARRQPFVDAVRASGKEVADFLGMRLVTVPPGRFDMAPDGFSDRVPQPTKVVLTRAYEMATCEVTQEQWTRVMGTRPWVGQVFAADAPEHAATYVSYDDAQEFLARLNACGERRYRLPTEAEWEWASRPGPEAKSPFWFAPDKLGDFAWHADSTLREGRAYAHPVGRKQASPRGLFDMVGNVHEWCHDRWDYWTWRRGGEKVDPMGGTPEAAVGDYRVLRGGSFYYRPAHVLSFPSSAHRPEYRNFDVGFRVVRLAP